MPLVGAFSSFFIIQGRQGGSALVGDVDTGQESRLGAQEAAFRVGLRRGVFS